MNTICAQCFTISRTEAENLSSPLHRNCENSSFLQFDRYGLEEGLKRTVDCIEAAKIAEYKSVLVRTGQDSQKLKGNEITCDYAANDLYDAVEYILPLS